MKILTAFLFLLSTFVVHQDVEAQTRGPRYNPNRGSGGSSSPSRSGGSSRGPRYNPSPSRGSSTPTTRPSRPSQPSRSGSYTPSRPSTGSSVGGSRPRGPRYNPNPGRGTSTPTRGPVVTRPNRPNPGSTVGSSTPRGPRYNPNPGRGTPGRQGPVVTRPNTGRTPRGPRYNPNPRTNPRGPVVRRPGPSRPTYRIPGHRYNRRIPGRVVRRTYHRPIRTHYGSRYYHRPFGYKPVRYAHYYHSPYRAPYRHTIRYYRTYDWYNYVYRINRNYVYAHWIFYPATGYRNGYWTIDNYPYYVYNGYRYRYSTNDYCNYQLVDSNNHQVVQTYWNQMCNTGYDACSYERDRLNSQMNDYRYFCSETWRDYGYDYSTPSYDSTSYPTSTDVGGGNTCTDANRDGMCDDYSNTCSDNDNDGYCDPGTYSPEFAEAI